MPRRLARATLMPSSSEISPLSCRSNFRFLETYLILCSGQERISLGSLRIQPKDVNVAIAEAGGQVASIVGESEAANGHARQLPVANLGHGLQVPQNDSAAVAHRGESLAIGGKKDQPDHAVVAFEHPQFRRLVALHVPELDRLLQAPQSERLALRAKRHR